MQASEVEVKLTHYDTWILQKINLQAKEGIKYLTLDKLLGIVNKFIENKKIQQFMDIQIKHKNQWKNILQVFGAAQFTKLDLDKVNNIYRIQLSLTKSKDLVNYGQLMKSWQTRIEGFNQKLQEIDQKFKKDTQLVEDQYGIDLAFFYAQPKVKCIKNTKNIISADTQVSFLNEVKKIFEKLNNENAIRSSKIQIQVATKSNLNRALSKGVKILHFSCHGQTNQGLQIQGQNENFAMSEYLQCGTLIKILSEHKQIPEIIVFNACCSDKLAETIHNQFANQHSLFHSQKYITTIGYSGKVKDSDCQQFAQTFYSKIFKGESVEEYLKASLSNEQIKIFYDVNRKIQLKPCKINELNKFIDVKTKLKTYGQNEDFPNVELYELMKKCKYNDKARILQVSGDSMVGKTLFVEKAISYLLQRGQITRVIKIQLRDNKHLISNVLQFKIKLKSQLRNAQLQNFNKTEYIAIVIDNCQILMKYQNKQFSQTIIELQKQLLEMKFKTRLIIVTSFSVQGKTSSSSIQKYQMQYQCVNKVMKINDVMNKYVMYWVKNSLSVQKKLQKDLKYLQVQSQQNFIKSCAFYIKQEMTKLPISFLAQLPLISLIPQHLIHFQVRPLNTLSTILKSRMRKPSAQRELQESIENKKQLLFEVQCENKVLKIEELCEKIIEDRHDSKQKQQNTILILKQMQLIIAVYFLKFNELNNYEENQMQQRKQKQNLYKLIRTTHKFINICVALKQSDIKISNREAYQTFQFKLYFIAYYSYSYNVKNDVMPKQITIKFIQNLSKQSREVGTNSLTLKYMLQLIQKSQQIANSIINSKTKSHLNFFDKQILQYLDNIQNLNQNAQTNSHIFNQQNMNVRNLKNQTQLYKVDLFDKNSKDLLYLPMLPLIKQWLNNKTQIQQWKIKKIMSIIKNMSFINQKQNIYSHIFKYFYEDYIECLFQIQKMKLTCKNISFNIKRIDVINKLNQWIKICNDHNFISLGNNINAYKNMSFNSLVALVSMPVNRIFRFQQHIMRMCQTACQNFHHSLFFRMNSFTEHVLEKYNQNDIPIPIALYILDTYQRNKQKFICLQNYSKDFKDNFCSTQKLKFLKCEIAIFCGEGVSKNIPIQNLKQKVGAFVFIDTLLNNQMCYDQKKRKQKKNQKSEKVQIVQVSQTFQKLKRGLIVKQILTNFYSCLCKTIFTVNFQNRQQQIKKSIQIAKDYSQIQCLLKYGAQYFYSEVEALFENFGYKILNENLMSMQPLKISETHNIFHKQQLQNTLIKNEKRRNSTAIDSIIIDEGVQLGYFSQLFNVLQKITKYYKNPNKSGSEFLFLICRNNEDQIFLNNLIVKIRKMGILQIKKIKQNQIIQILPSTTASMFKKPFHLSGEEDNTLQIIQLKQIKNRPADREQILQIIYAKLGHQQKIQMCQKNLGQFANRVIIFVIQQFPFFSADSPNSEEDFLDNYPQLSQIAKQQKQTTINSLEKQNILPLLCYQQIVSKFELKSKQNKEIQKNWPNNSFNTIIKKFSKKVIQYKKIHKNEDKQT